MAPETRVQDKVKFVETTLDIVKPEIVVSVGGTYEVFSRRRRSVLASAVLNAKKEYICPFST